MSKTKRFIKVDDIVNVEKIAQSDQYNFNNHNENKRIKSINLINHNTETLIRIFEDMEKINKYEIDNIQENGHIPNTTKITWGQYLNVITTKSGLKDIRSVDLYNFYKNECGFKCLYEERRKAKGDYNYNMQNTIFDSYKKSNENEKRYILEFYEVLKKTKPNIILQQGYKIYLKNKDKPIIRFIDILSWSRYYNHKDEITTTVNIYECKKNTFSVATNEDQLDEYCNIMEFYKQKGIITFYHASFIVDEPIIDVSPSKYHVLHIDYFKNQPKPQTP